MPKIRDRDASKDVDVLLDYGSEVPDARSSITSLDLSAQSNAKHKDLLELFHVLQFEFVPDLFKQRPCVEEMIRLMKKIMRIRSSYPTFHTDEDDIIAEDTARLAELMDMFIVSDAHPLPRSFLELDHVSWLYVRCCGLRDALEFEELVECDAYRDTMKMCRTLEAFLYVDYNEEGRLKEAMKDINDLGTLFFTSPDQYFGKIFRGEIKL